MLDCTMFNLSPEFLSSSRSLSSSGISTFAPTFNKYDFDPLLRKHKTSPKLKEKKCCGVLILLVVVLYGSSD